MLEGKQLARSIAGRKVVDAADVSLAPGEIAVIVGPSGSGKTSLLKLMALLDKPDSGSVFVDGTQYFPPVKNVFTPPWPKVTVVFSAAFSLAAFDLIGKYKAAIDAPQQLEAGRGEAQR